MKAAYLRLRDPNQAAPATGRMLEFANKIGWKVEWFIDQPRVRILRPRFQDLQRRILKGECDGVIFMSIGQFAHIVVDGSVDLINWSKWKVQPSFVEGLPDWHDEMPSLHTVFFAMQAMRDGMMTVAVERASIRRKRSLNTGVLRQNKARKMRREGHTDEVIGAELGIKNMATVARMCRKKKLYWGGKHARIGKRKGSPAKAFRLWDRQHMSYREIASVLDLSAATIMRYVEEVLAGRDHSSG